MKKPVTPSKSKILIIDDHSIVRFGIRALIAQNKNMEVCAEAEDSKSALKIFSACKPNIALVDISIEGNGLELTKQLVKCDPKIKIIVISMHDEVMYADRALKAGARGYLMKRDASRLLLQAIDTVNQGEIYLSEAMTKLMLNKIATQGSMSLTSPEDILSDRELEVFQLIGLGEQNKQIAEKLSVSPKTIETYREHIKSKLSIPDSIELKRRAIAWCKSNQ